MAIKDELISIVDNVFSELDKEPQRAETTDYIRRESIGALRPKNVKIINSRGYVDMEELLDMVDALPAADVEPVRHGKWVEAGRGINACSECNHGIREHMACVNKYCPNCGAKMDYLED